nr:Protein of uncharacterised function (DUF2029) [Streptococcus thermophilus]
MLLYSTMLFALLQAAVTVPFRNPGTDFTPVWTAARKYLAGEPVFDSDYTVDMPHYLYTPAGTVVIAPIGIFDDQSTGRLVMLALGTLCIIAALALATWMVTTRHFHHVFPLIVTVVFLTPEPVRTTLWLTNINGFLLLLMVVFVWCSLRLRGAGWNEHLTRPEAYVAGIAAGVAISVKPQFGVLLIISVLLLQAAVVLIAAVTCTALFTVGWFTIAQPELFFTNLVPYLSEPRPRFNGSVAGLGIVFGWPEWVVTLLTLLVVAATVAAVVKLWQWRDVDDVMWAFTTVGVCFAGGFMASGLLQTYYAIWLLPMVLTVVRPQSPMHWPAMWLVVLFIFANPKWPFASVILGSLPPAMFFAAPFVVTAWACATRPFAPVRPVRHVR